jgi:lipoyl(octanoyl) transferase
VKLQLIDLGQCPYRDAWDLQRAVHGQVVSSTCDGALILVEHPPVVTLGKNADPRFVLMAPEALAGLGADLVQIDRGGEVTAHMPGQLVFYPIIRLGPFGLGPKSFVSSLEKSVIETLDEYGIRAATSPDFPGVWVGTRKICAVGIRITERVSMHGIALNIANGFELFDAIVPCGIQGRGVTSMNRELKSEILMSDVARKLVANFSKILDCSVETHSDRVQLPSSRRGTII